MGRRVPTIWSRDLSTQSVVVTVNSLLHFVASVQKAQRYKRGLVPAQEEEEEEENYRYAFEISLSLSLA